MKKRISGRRITQLVCAALYNCHITGFADGALYQGMAKGVCVPGLNCYSCPGAVAACPLGTLQTALMGSVYKVPYYVLGLLLVFGTLLGRVICGFLCPFGLLQELLFKIPGPKLKKGAWSRGLSWLKFVVLFFCVLLLPILWMEPVFCKWICPAGTLEGGLPLLAATEDLQEYVGMLLYWKLTVMVLLLLSFVFCYRSFCRFICPLGALYGLFAKLAIFGMKVDAEKCNDCGACVRACRMDVKCVGDRECISCMECRKVCPEGALSFGVCAGCKGKS